MTNLLKKVEGNGLHRCEGYFPDDECGPAVFECVGEVDGTLWVSNGEYASQVAFCPYCGHKAKVQPCLDMRRFSAAERERMSKILEIRSELEIQSEEV